jgi:hypothetical protein
MGILGTEFEKNGTNFIVLDEKDKGNNRLATCGKCQAKIRRDTAERHAKANH